MSGQFVNMARVHPELLSSGNPVRIKKTNVLAIGIMALSVQDSFLRSPGKFGTTTLDAYKIAGFPLAQEWRRECSLWGTLLPFPKPIISGPVGSNRVSFYTRTPSKANAAQSKLFSVFSLLFWLTPLLP